MDFGTTIRKAQGVENLAGDLYLLLAARSAPDDAAAFRRLEQEEREHANRLQMLGSMYLKDPKAFRGVQLETQTFDAIAAELCAFRDDVEHGTLDMRGAVARLVDFEERFAVAHAEVVARNADPGVKTLFAMLASQDREHAKLLRNRGMQAP
jgi:rubrerythrin